MPVSRYGPGLSGGSPRTFASHCTAGGGLIVVAVIVSELKTKGKTAAAVASAGAGDPRVKAIFSFVLYIAITGTVGMPFPVGASLLAMAGTGEIPTP